MGVVHVEGLKRVRDKREDSPVEAAASLPGEEARQVVVDAVPLDRSPSRPSRRGS